MNNENRTEEPNGKAVPGTTRDDMTDDLHVAIARSQDAIREIDGHVRRFVQQRPMACVLGAVGIGYIVARLARRR